MEKEMELFQRLIHEDIGKSILERKEGFEDFDFRSIEEGEGVPHGYWVTQNSTRSVSGTNQILDEDQNIQMPDTRNTPISVVEHISFHSAEEFWELPVYSEDSQTFHITFNGQGAINVPPFHQSSQYNEPCPVFSNLPTITLNQQQLVSTNGPFQSNQQVLPEPISYVSMSDAYSDDLEGRGQLSGQASPRWPEWQIPGDEPLNEAMRALSSAPLEMEMYREEDHHLDPFSPPSEFEAAMLSYNHWDSADLPVSTPASADLGPRLSPSPQPVSHAGSFEDAKAEGTLRPSSERRPSSPTPDPQPKFPGRCPECGKWLESKQKYRTHKKTHREKTHFCNKDGCIRAFQTAKDLKRHKACLRHNRLNPCSRVCHLCGKAFNRNDNLRRHLRNKHEKVVNKRSNEVC